MKIARTETLISPKQGLLLDGTDTSSYNQPPNLVDWAAMYDELVWTIYIGAVPTGTPSTWSLSAQFQYRVGVSGSQPFQNQGPYWYALADEQIGTHVVEGVGWYGPGQADPGGSAGLIANQASSLGSPIVVTRTLRHFPAGVRLALTVAQSGGTSPVLPLGVQVVGR